MIPLKSIRSFLGGTKITEKLLPLFPDIGVGDVPFNLGSRTIDSARKFSGGSISIPVRLRIGDVGGVRANPKIGQPVVEGIPVNMVNNHSLWHLNPIKGKDDSVDQKFSLLAFIQKGKRKIHRSLCGCLKAHRSHLSFLLSFLSEKFSGLWVVSKIPLKKINRGQISIRLHSALSVWSLGAFGSSELPDAPSLYTHQSPLAN